MDGYAKVAELMGRYPEFAIFRRFRAANLRNLLYLQAEITHLEEKLQSIVSRDIRHGPLRENFPHDWWSLSHGKSEEDKEQWQKVCELRERLEQYSISSDRSLIELEAESNR
jgi:hypothetical protein